LGGRTRSETTCSNKKPKRKRQDRLVPVIADEIGSRTKHRGLMRGARQDDTLHPAPASPQITVMVTPQGLALIAELIAGLSLFVGIVGFGIRRTKPWLVVSVLAAAMRALFRVCTTPGEAAGFCSPSVINCRNSRQAE
jgi:hypothetical protein